MSPTRRHLLAASVAAAAWAPRVARAEPGVAAIPVVARYQAALKAMAPSLPPDFVSLEGYMAERLAIDALRLTGASPTRSPFDLGGFTLIFGPGHNQGSDQVFLTVLQADGSFRQVGTLTRNAS
ncbi:MAG TPA: hypothetical protein VGM42_11390 [Rhodopila sp.]|jgi:hypothetical protein